MKVRGVRGATTVERNRAEDILHETEVLLKEIVNVNEIEPDDIASVFITVSPDLNATFPARAIRSMPGWKFVPLMCGQEIPVPNGLPRCIRLMILVNTHKRADHIQHVYLNEAVSLRPDLS